MSEKVLIDNEYIKMVHLVDKGIIYHTFHQPLTGQAFRDAMDTGTEELAAHGLTKWLSDDRKNGPLSQEDTAWGFDDWIPRTMAGGWQYWANVVPEEIDAAGSLMPVIQELAKFGLRMMVFTDLDRAMKWLNKR
ncbi:MAG: hypothetical protein JXQ72_02795 [Anaerolineae bacterium]|nr:hypothetical protein [Anaerolineae bacterium]